MMKQKLNCILLIDDDEPTNFLNQYIIEEADCAHTVLVEQSGRDAIDYLKSRKVQATDDPQYPLPDLLFLDINMPAMDGWEFLDEYSKLYPGQMSTIIVVMLTTSFNPEDAAKAREHDYISEFRNKPLTVEMLMSILKRNFPERF